MGRPDGPLESIPAWLVRFALKAMETKLRPPDYFRSMVSALNSYGSDREADLALLGCAGTA